MKKLLLALSALLIVLSPSVALAGPLPPVYPPSYYQTRQVQAYVAASRVSMGTSTTIVASVYGNTTQSAISGEQLRLQMIGGDGNVANSVSGSYSYANARGSIDMDHICYNKYDASRIQDNVLVRNASNFAAVSIAAFSQPCAPNYVDSGWYIAKIFAPLAGDRDQMQQMTITDLSDPNTARASASLNTIATRGNGSDLARLNVVSLNQPVNPNNDVPFIVFANDKRGIGLTCISSSKVPGESSTDSGCNVGRDGYSASTESTIDINQNFVSAGHAGAIDMSLSGIVNAKVYSRGASVSSLYDHNILTSLGGGAYFFVTKAGTRIDRAETVLNGYTLLTGGIAPVLARFNVVPFVFPTF